MKKLYILMSLVALSASTNAQTNLISNSDFEIKVIVQDEPTEYGGG